MRVLIDDLEIMGHSRYLLFSFLQSLPFLLLQIVPTFAAFRAYGFDLSLMAAFALAVILRLGAAVPQAPGNLGLFQLLARESLQRMFGIVPAEAARFSLVLWGLTTIPSVGRGIDLADGCRIEVQPVASGNDWKRVARVAALVVNRAPLAGWGQGLLLVEQFANVESLIPLDNSRGSETLLQYGDFTEPRQ